MLRSILLKTLRDQRWPAVMWGTGLGLLLVGFTAGWANAYPDAASRLRLAREVESSLAVGQAFYGQPHNIDRLGGFLEWRGMGLYRVLLGLFIIIAATRVSRGAEERGEVDVVLVAARGRMRMFAEQAGGLALALIAACVLIWLALLISGPAAGDAGLPAGWAALSVLNAGLGAALFGAVALLVAQFAPTRRAALLIAGTALFTAHIWDNLGLVAPSLAGVRWLSPLHLVSRSSPLGEGRVDVVALTLLALLTLGCAVVAGRLFVQRDIGATVRTSLPCGIRSLFVARMAWGGRGSWLLGNSLQWGLRSALGSAAAWGLALGAYAALVAGIAPTVRSAFAGEADLQRTVGRLQRGNIGSEAGFVAIGLFSLLPALVTLFAATLASAWAAEERAGRLEVELSAPLPRRRYFIERAVAAIGAVVVVVALVSGCFVVAALAAGTDLPWGRALVALVTLVPLAAVAVAFGYAVSAWQPGPVAGMLGLALAASYFLDLLAPLLGLPDTVRRISIFRLYGQPLTDGVRWGAVAVMIGLSAALIAAGSAAFARRDIAK